jgi:hypothetical protein
MGHLPVNEVEIKFDRSLKEEYSKSKIDDELEKMLSPYLK